MTLLEPWQSATYPEFLVMAYKELILSQRPLRLKIHFIQVYTNENYSIDNNIPFHT